MERGSEWRKWDLHVHTPGTAKSKGQGAEVNPQSWTG